MERRALRTLLSQGAAGGAVGTFLSTFIAIIYFTEYGFEIVLLFPFSLLVGMVMGTATGFVIWISQKVINQNLKVPSRIVISILFTIFLSVLFTVLLSATLQARAENPSGYRFLYHILFATPIGMLAGSRVRPWRLIARGINGGSMTRVLFKRGPIRISQTIKELGLTGLPLRVASLLALMVSCLLAAFYFSLLWWERASFKTFVDLTESLLATAYFGLTCAVSFTERRKLDVLIISALNVPWAIWMLKTDTPDPNPFALLLVTIFIICWLLFMTGMIGFPEKGSLQVEYGRTEIRFGKQQWVKETQ